MAERLKLYISYPSGRDPRGRFVGSLNDLVSYLCRTGTKLDGYDLEPFTYRSWGGVSLLPVARQQFVDEMIALDCTHWLSLDDDMTFPMDIVDRLLAHGKDVVSCNARVKMRDINEYRGSCTGMDGVPVNSCGKSGLEEIQHMGGAIFLARVSAIKDIPRPHFQVLWHPELQTYVGEDVYFSMLLKEHGIQLFCDHDTSREIGHVGEYLYEWPKKPVELKAVA